MRDALEACLSVFDNLDGAHRVTDDEELANTKLMVEHALRNNDPRDPIEIQREAVSTFMQVPVHKVEAYALHIGGTNATIVVNYIEVTDPNDRATHAIVPIIVMPLFKNFTQAADGTQVLLGNGLDAFAKCVMDPPKRTVQ
jgi:hypothetical protein